jgi:hypothetical protein
MTHGTPDTEDGAAADQPAHAPFHVKKATDQQGRVRPTLPVGTGLPINDDAGLEREAGVIGARALWGAGTLDTELTHVSSAMQEKPM